MSYCLVEITAALMLYIFILFIICILYRIFVFRKLGERRFLITLLLFFMGAVAMPVCWWQECFIAFFMGMVLSICMATCLLNDVDGWCEMRRRKKLATLPARKLKSCTMSFAVTRDDLLANFRELAEKDELACYEPANNFLSWNDGQGYIIQVHLQPEADSWVAIFYSPSPSELRDSEIKQACGKAKLPCFPGLLGMAPAGLAICQQGQVTITPASQKKHFEEFCGKILAHREHFADWLAEYTEIPDES